MIEYKHDKNGASLKVEGNIETITAEVTLLVSMVYGSIHEDNALSALGYRMALMHTLSVRELEPVIWSETASSAGTKIRVDSDFLKRMADMVKDDDDDGE